MEVPTTWCIDSKNKAPPPLRIDETGQSTPSVAAQRYAGKSPSPTRCSQGSPSPTRSPGSSPAPISRQPKEPLPGPGGRMFAPTLSEYIAYPQSKDQPPEAAPASFIASMTTSPPSRAKTSPGVPGNKRNADPLAEPQHSTSSIGSAALPLQDSTTSTVASLSSYPRAVSSTSKPGNKAPASRASTRTPGISATSSPNSTFYGASPLKGNISEFSPSLGAGERPGRSSTAQAQRTSGMFPADGGMPHKTPPRRTATASGQRDVVWGGSRSSGSLPLTNAGGRMKPGSSPLRHAGQRFASDDKAAKAELAAAQSEGHLPELLPAFKPGKVHKAPKPPSWMVPL